MEYTLQSRGFMKISALCLKTDMTKDTIRFYEKLGLLTKIERAANGYKLYTNAHVEQLLLIKHAKELGFTLDEIKQLATLLFSKQLTITEMERFLKQKEQEIDHKILKLQQFKEQISLTLKGRCEYQAQLKKFAQK